MSIKVEDYLIRLEDEIHTRRSFYDGSTLLCADDLRKKEIFPGFSKNELETTTLPSGLRLYLKRFYCDNDTSKKSITNEVFFSRLYNALGVNAVKYYPLIVNQNDMGENYGTDVAVASQDLNSLKGISVDPFSSQRIFDRFIGLCNLRIEKILKEQDKLYAKCKDDVEFQKMRMLLANFIKTGLLDIICMMVDNHLGNKNVVKNFRSSIAEDVISFDLEDTAIDNFNNGTYKDFKYEIAHDTTMFDGFIAVNGKGYKRSGYTYIDYLSQMKSLRDDGLLPAECIELFDKIVNLDVEKLLTSVECETGLIMPEYKKDYFKKLIDINQETFSR